MDSVSVDITYGKALYDAVEDLNKTDSTVAGLKELVQIVKENPSLLALLKSPSVSKKDKKDVIEKIFGEELDETLQNFLYVLIDKRRIGQLYGIAKEFEKCVDEKKGITSGIIYSAVDIPEEKIKKLEEQTSALLKKNVELKNEIDTTLIGGVRIYVDGKLIDASLRKRLDDLKEHLL